MNTKTSQKQNKKLKQPQIKKGGGGRGGLIPYPAVLDEGRQVSEGYVRSSNVSTCMISVVTASATNHCSVTHTHTGKPSNQYGGAGMAQSLMVE